MIINVNNNITKNNSVNLPDITPQAGSQKSSYTEKASKLNVGGLYNSQVLITSTETNIPPSLKTAIVDVESSQAPNSAEFTGATYDVTEITQSVKLVERRDGEATTCTIELVLDPVNSAPFPIGSLVVFKIDNVNQFLGFIFDITRNRWGVTKLTCYDCLRYLKNVIYVFKDIDTPGKEIVETAIKEVGLKPDIKIEADYRWPRMPFIQYQKTAIDMINWVLSRSIASGLIKDAYCFRANYDMPGKTVQLMYCKENIKDYVIGIDSLLTDFEIQCNIDQETFNRVQIIFDDGTNMGIMQSVAVTGIKSATEWGLLTYVKQQEANYYATLAQEGWKGGPKKPTRQDVFTFIKEWATNMLEYYNRPYYNLVMKCIGIPGLRAGDMVQIDIPGIGIGKVEGEWSNMGIVETISHNYEESFHTMDVVMRIGVVERSSIPIDNKITEIKEENIENKEIAGPNEPPIIN